MKKLVVIIFDIVTIEVIIEIVYYSKFGKSTNIDTYNNDMSI